MAADERRRAALRALGGKPPMPVAEARAIVSQLPELDTSTLVADRAEAAAELAAARRALGLPETPPEPAERPAVAPPAPPFNPAPLREAAQAVLEAARWVEVAEAAPEATAQADPGALAAADQAVANAEAAQDQLAPAWRRTVGALISGTGMAIVIAALGWPAWWYLIPIVVIAIVTADLRVAGSAAQEASSQAKEQLAALGLGGADGVQRLRAQVKEQDSAGRIEEARRHQEEALARWSELAPGEDPAGVEDLVARRMAAAPVNSASSAAGEPADDDLPVGETDPVLVLAVRLAQEARNTIILIDDQLALAARVEHARRSLEWHELQPGFGAT